jgi:hypothetical protein
MIENILHLPPVSTTLVVHPELRYLREFSKKNRNGPNGTYTQGLGGN